MWKETKTKYDFNLIENEGGKTLGYSPSSGIKILEKDGFAFKDFLGNGKLLPYEDWRLSARERAEDLAKRLSTEEIAGLMLYSPHQMVPSLPGMPFPATYGQKSFPESGEEAWAISDQLHEMIAAGHVRHILLMRCQDTGTAANWSNAVQALCESLPHGIPANVCSHPRHGAGQAGAEHGDCFHAYSSVFFLAAGFFAVLFFTAAEALLLAVVLVPALFPAVSVLAGVFFL